MAENSKIEWTDHTFNPWMGCEKVSPACAHCYAERDMDHRYGKVSWGPNGTRVITSDANWRKPLQWNSAAAESGVRPRVFCASLADVFEDWTGRVHDSNGNALWTNESIGVFEVDDGQAGFAFRRHWTTMKEVRRRLFALIDATPNIDWMLLTKRPENIRRMWDYSRKLKTSRVSQNAGDNVDVFRPSVWLGTSVENQEYADKRIPELMKCRDLSPVLFLSCEPLLGPVDLMEIEETTPAGKRWWSSMETGSPEGHTIDWVIAGGESGPNARPSDPEWFRSLQDQCATAGVPFLFKQWGEFDETQTRVGKKKAGRLLDGRTHDQFPQVTP